MDFSVSSNRRLAETPLLVVFVPEGGKISLPASISVPEGFLKSFKGKKSTSDHAWTLSGPAERVLLVGLGKPGQVGTEELRRAAAGAIRSANKMRVDSLTIWASGSLTRLKLDQGWTGRSIAEGIILGNYRFRGQKTDKPSKRVSSAVLVSSDTKVRQGAEKGIITAEACSFARDLQNQAANLMTPSVLANEADRIAQNCPSISCEILDEDEMEKLGMGLIMAVSQGSVEPARFIHLTYKPKAEPVGKVALVGKGLTFDAGGISLKPAAKMDEMRYDMSGAAAVLGTFFALSKIDVKQEVHGIIPSSENLLGAAAVKPGDIHCAMNGKSVEILNTDAEGRLILADALCYVAEKIKPDTIIDLATLTGAVIHGLGHELTAMFPRSAKLRNALSKAGELTGELVWELPLLDVHRDAMKGQCGGDLSNLSKAGVGAGTVTGAAFLDYFVPGKFDWCHLDIAGTAWGAKDVGWRGGALGTGVGTRLLVEYLVSC